MKKGILLSLGLILLVSICMTGWYFSSEFRRQLFFAKQGDVDAQIFVAQSYQKGLKGLSKNPCQANKWWAIAAKQNNTTAKIALGNLYIAQYNLVPSCIFLHEKDIKHYITLATEQGNYQGYYVLAEHYTNKIEQKILYLEQGAVHHDARALFALASHYFTRNQAYAIHLMESAAELDHSNAQTFLGDIYAGMTYTTKHIDLSKAILWYNKAANHGHITAQKNLALLYLYGQGTAQNYDQAAYWLKKSAQQGDQESKLILAMLIMYDRGLSIPQYGSKNQSLEVIQSLADQGYVEAQVEIARLYLLGIGVLQNYQKAAEWFQKAANHSDRLAQYQLGLLYATGKGVTKNLSKATALFYQSRYTEYIDTSKPNGKGVIDEGYPYFKSY